MVGAWHQAERVKHGERGLCGWFYLSRATIKDDTDMGENWALMKALIGTKKGIGGSSLSSFERVHILGVCKRFSSVDVG